METKVSEKLDEEIIVEMAEDEAVEAVIPGNIGMNVEKFESAWAKMFEIGAKQGYSRFLQYYDVLEYESPFDFHKDVPESWGQPLWAEPHYNPSSGNWDMFELLYQTEDGVILVVSEGRTYMKYLTSKLSETPDGDDMTGIPKEVDDWWESLNRPTPLEEVVKEKELAVTYSYLSSQGPATRRKIIDAQPWEEIETNYPAELKEQLAKLCVYDDPASGGKIILMYGEPGTGKTSFIQTLGYEWADWANIITLVEPEKFFSSAAYMIETILDQAVEDKWNILIVEDAGELIAENAGGQGLARLLNMADGLLGRNSKVLTLITTNQELDEVNGAVRRTGRCLFEGEFGRLSCEESSNWLKEHGVEKTESQVKKATDGKGMTIGELYAEIGSITKIESTIEEEEVSTGQYA